MAENKKTKEARDYSERFEFRLTVDNNIICQRYFKINNFNPICLRSFELVDSIRKCADTIHKDLLSKTQVYLEMFTPQIFNDEEEMNTFFSKEENRKRMHLGEGIVLRNNPGKNFFWGGKEGEEKPIECSTTFDNGELPNGLSETDRRYYKFAFFVDGREVCSTIWEGVYPKYICNSIDLTNKKGRYEGEDKTRLSFEMYLLYKLVEGRNDLVYGIIKEICYTCSEPDNDWYTTSDVYRSLDENGKVVFEKEYKNISDKRVR